MNRHISMSSFVIILGLSGWHASVAYAQPSTQDVQIYAGYLFGDRLLEQPLSGSTIAATIRPKDKRLNHTARD
jgi:hypothetical protein